MTDYCSNRLITEAYLSMREPYGDAYVRFKDGSKEPLSWARDIRSAVSEYRDFIRSANPDGDVPGIEGISVNGKWYGADVVRGIEGELDRDEEDDERLRRFQPSKEKMFAFLNGIPRKDGLDIGVGGVTVTTSVIPDGDLDDAEREVRDYLDGKFDPNDYDVDTVGAVGGRRIEVLVKRGALNSRGFYDEEMGGVD